MGVTQALLVVDLQIEDAGAQQRLMLQIDISQQVS
jgi:hypothetical protein